MLAGHFRTQTQDTGTIMDKKIHEDFFAAAPENADRVLRTDITLKRKSYSATYKRESVSSSTR